MAGVNPLLADTKELVFRIHEYFESECEDAKYGRPLISIANVWPGRKKLRSFIGNEIS